MSNQNPHRNPAAIAAPHPRGNDASASSLQEQQLLRELHDPDYILPLKNISAKVTEGNERRGHGLRVEISADCSPDLPHLNRISLDVHGTKLFDSLPYGMGYIAPSFLPAEVHLSRAGGRGFTAEFTIAGHKLSRGRIDQVLSSIISNGDHPFVLELRNPSNDQLLGYFPSRASLMQASLAAGGRNARFVGSLPAFKRKSLILPWIQWWKCALIFSMLSWALLLSPSTVLQYAPRSFVVSGHNSTVDDLLPFCPMNMTAAFKLGQLQTKISQRIDDMGNDFQDTDDVILSVLREAEAIVGRPPHSASISDLMNTYAEIQKVENSISIATRVKGFFSFINMLWFMAICGISAAILPSLYHLLRPFRDWWIRLATWFMNDVVIPVGMRLHSYGVFEILGYTMCFALLADGYRIPPASGHYVALTGAVLLIPAASYSTAVWGLRLARKLDHVTLMQLWGTWAALTWTPVALHFSSGLVGFAVVTALYVCLGFCGGVGRLCLFIGFRGSSETLRVCVTSFIVVCLFVAAKFLQLGTPYFWGPFSCAISTMGSNMLFLSLLILCETGVSGQDRQSQRLAFNVIMLVLLLVFAALGLTLGLTALSNTATTYLVIWLLQRYAVLHFESKFHPWFLVLILSTALWKISLYLHQQPEYVVSLFTIME